MRTWYGAWLDERDTRLPLTRADLYSANDHAAARAVAAGAGMQALIEATGLRTLANVLALIDPAILEQAPPNDATSPHARLPPVTERACPEHQSCRVSAHLRQKGRDAVDARVEVAARAGASGAD